eukprot:CAMPEP_0182441986 /NCGR_PEP_ID=MMETSP1172-20130603/962_1 /TAXON_ID=708627 /ORGANISM="Timspurckia oligopyrenoides, Strain CCMP3278" /LENGTH=385 /DNA_ID=CAMNT_0024636623 /DNA_START=127 /DNA_END=1284 /DNA_ORIENTATION=+
MSDDEDWGDRKKRVRSLHTLGLVDERPFARHHVSLLGSERTLSTCELVLAAMGQCFLATLTGEATHLKIPVTSISVNVHGTVNLWPILDPQSKEIARFISVEIVASVSTDDPSSTRKTMNLAFERAKVRAPICNSVKYGVPLDMKCAKLSPQEAASTDVVMTRTMRRAALEDEGMQFVEKVRKFMKSNSSASSMAAFDVELTGLASPEDEKDFGTDVLIVFPGLDFESDGQSFRRQNPIEFRASQPDKTFPSAPGMASTLIGEYPKAVGTLTAALGTCVAVNACYRTGGRGRRVTMDEVNVNVSGKWNADTFIQYEDFNTLCKFYTLSVNVNVEPDSEDEKLSDEELKMKEQALSEIFETALQTSFVANTLSGKSQVTFSLRLER